MRLCPPAAWQVPPWSIVLTLLPLTPFLACTSVVTEISHNYKDVYEADVHFLAEVEWRKEVSVLLGDLQEDSDEKDSSRYSPWRDTGPSSDDAMASIAWAKVYDP